MFRGMIYLLDRSCSIPPTVHTDPDPVALDSGSGRDRFKGKRWGDRDLLKPSALDWSQRMY